MCQDKGFVGVRFRSLAAVDLRVCVYSQRKAPRDYLAITSSNENLNCSDVGEEIKEEELNANEGCKGNQTNIFSFGASTIEAESSKRCEITGREKTIIA